MPWSVIMDSGEESQRIREQSTREWKIKLYVEDAPTEYCKNTFALVLIWTNKLVFKKYKAIYNLDIVW